MPFMNAGTWIVEHSDVLVAVWNGLPARGEGGTADDVKMALRVKHSVWHVDTDSLTTRYLSSDS
jgi:hypothetical protein